MAVCGRLAMVMVRASRTGTVTCVHAFDWLTCFDPMLSVSSSSVRLPRARPSFQQCWAPVLCGVRMAQQLIL